jgi:arylsulfatase A-like enzyme
MIRFPGAEHAGTSSDVLVQHHDITAVVLEAAGVEPPEPLDGISFVDDALNGGRGHRDHVTVGWGSTPTVITKKWWFNCKADGTGSLLYDLEADDPFTENVADEHPDVVRGLFAVALEDAGGDFPGWIVELAKNQADAPGCSNLAARA